MKLFLVIPVMLLLAGCFQAHSDDDLRAIPVTNNPNIVPSGGQNGQFTGVPY